MTNLPITLTAADYARLMPLTTRAVVPDGIDLALLLGRAGSWPERAEMLRRAGADPAVHGGESSMGGHLRRIDKGDRSLVALPVFPLRSIEEASSSSLLLLRSQSNPRLTPTRNSQGPKRRAVSKRSRRVYTRQKVSCAKSRACSGSRTRRVRTRINFRS